MATEQDAFERTRSGFVRGFSWVDVFMFVVATPAASGVVYYSVSAKPDFPGGSIPLAFVFGLIMFFPICLLIASTSSMLPRAGGLYVLISRVISPSLGYVAAWLLFVGYGLCLGMFGYIVMGIAGGAMQMVVGTTQGGWASEFAAWLQTAVGKSVGGVLWVLFLWVCFAGGLGWIRNLLRVSFLIPGIATIVALVAFVAVGPGGAATAFDSVWGANSYQKVLATAHSLGWSPQPFSLSATASALLVVIWAYTTIEAINYASSEVRNPKKSMMRGFMLGLTAVGVLYILVAFGVYYCFGDFVDAYGFLHKAHHDALLQIMPAVDPSVPFFASAVIPNKFLALTVVLSLLLWFFNSMPGVFLAASRIAYAMSVDNIFPQVMQKVSIKRGIPVWATHATAFLGLLGVALMTLQITQVLSIFNFCFLFVFWAYGLAAMVLPFKNPVMYADSPIQARVWGIPVVSVLGLIVFLEGWYFLFLSVGGLGTVGSLVVLAVLFLGLLLNLYYRKKSQSLGIDLQEGFKKIPLD